jgi:cytochrome c oxidase cbb3-type subunit 3
MVSLSNFCWAGTATLINQIAIMAMVFVLLLIGVVCLVLLKTIKALSAILLPKEEEVLETVKPDCEYVLEPSTPKLTFWQKVLSLRPMEEEKNMLIEHDYDGIRELDNPTPAWFMWLFYITIIFAFTYMLNFHVFKLSPLQDEEYAVEMKNADIEKQAFLAKSANRVDENSVKLSTDVAVLNDGKGIFMKNCVPCHGQHAEGIVGPNLTDEFWLHGGKIGNLFKTIKNGVPDKGMISWEKQLTPKQIADVANYIKSLAGSHPANPKAPQGDKEI